MNELYKRIEFLCEKKGINITTMCKESGAPRGSLSDLKMGRIPGLSAATLSKIATYFGVSMESLLGQEEQKEKATIDVVDDDLREYLEELRTRPEMRMLFSTTKTATKEQIEAIVRFIEGLRN